MVIMVDGGYLWLPIDRGILNHAQGLLLMLAGHQSVWHNKPGP
jgi:hypothetical protein